MKYGINLPTTGPLATPDGLRALAACAEEEGCHSLWIGDHVAVPADFTSRYPYSTTGRVAWDPGLPWPDPFQALAWVAASTSQICIGTSVLILPLRPPVAVAHSAATLDWLSQGRFSLGVGAGWMREEFTLLDQPFDGRGARMDEAIQILRRCWGPDPVEFRGAHFDLAPFAINPKPFQAAGPPIICGGHSDAALRRVAKLADGWQPYRLSPEDLADRKAVLEGLLRSHGRTFEELRFSFRLNESDPLTPAQSKAYRELGVELLIQDIDYTDLSIADLRQKLHARARLVD